MIITYVTLLNCLTATSPQFLCVAMETPPNPPPPRNFPIVISLGLKKTNPSPGDAIFKYFESTNNKNYYNIVIGVLWHKNDLLENLSQTSRVVHLGRLVSNYRLLKISAEIHACHHYWIRMGKGKAEFKFKFNFVFCKTSQKNTHTHTHTHTPPHPFK